MQKAHQLSFCDYQIEVNRKKSRTEKKLSIINEIVDWDKLLDIVSSIDKSQTSQGGRPRCELLMMSKILFIQYTYNLSDPEMEDQLNDRLSFQRFAGIGIETKVPNYSTIWRFKEDLLKEGLLDKIFELINSDLENHGLFVKKGTIVDATIIQSSNKPLSKEKRNKLTKEPSSQIDTDAYSTKKNGKYHFGYKGHIGVDQGSKLIRKRTFTAANVHDSQELENLISGDEEALYGDKAYPNDDLKRKCRKLGIYYGILDKCKRGQKLSKRQQKRNKQKSRVRSQVEHPFGYIKSKLNMGLAEAKTKLRNELRFDMNCIIYNIMRANYLLQ
jgi:IS5 family transposase